MAAAETFGVRFHVAGGHNPKNPFTFYGPGELVVEPDFVTVRGKRHRAFRSGVPQEHRLRMVDIVNVRSDGHDVFFDVIGVKQDLSVGFGVDDPSEIGRIMTLLPARMTEEFAVAQADRDTFHERIDHWTPSTPVVWALLAINLIVFALMYLDKWGARSMMSESDWLVRWGSNKGQLTLQGQWWRLVTSMFLHGGLLHIGFNMLALWQVGQLVERMFGSARFLALYMLAGVCGSLSSVLWNLLWNPYMNSVGASGAIFGIIGGLLAFIQKPDSGVPGTIVKDIRGSLTGFLLFNIGAGLVYPHTDNAAHIGGLAGGYLLGHLLARSLHVPEQRKG